MEVGYMADNMTGKLSSILTKTVATVNVKTSVFMESAKLKTQISTLQNEIRDMVFDIGSTVYELWADDSSDPDLIHEKCRQIQEKHQAIERLEQEIELLDKKEDEVFGAKNAAGDKAASDQAPEAVEGYVCPNCNTQYQSPIKFCKKCGQKMS